MKTLATTWKVIAVGTLAVIVTIWAGSGIKAKARQDYAEQSARVRPHVREAAIGLLGPIGLTHGQTLRIGLLLPGPGGGPHALGGTVTISDCHGNILAMFTATLTINECSFFDVFADQLPQAEFDNAGRAELTVGLTVSGNINRPGSFFATAQVFDNVTGKTTAFAHILPF